MKRHSRRTDASVNEDEPTWSTRLVEVVGYCVSDDTTNDARATDNIGRGCLHFRDGTRIGTCKFFDTSAFL